jgi:ribokinase
VVDVSERTLRIAAVGIASWDRLLAVDRYPAPGEQAVVRAEASGPGGTTTNTAVALARLGVEVAVAAAVGDDADGRAIRAALGEAGIDDRWLLARPGERTDAATIVVSREPLDRTIHWHQGAQLVRGDTLDVAAIFGHDLVVLDVADVPLRRFLLDLPAHTLPRTRILGPLGYLALPDLPDALDLTLRHDVVVGNERELLTVTGTWTLGDATAALRTGMRGATLRAAVVTRGAAGCRIITADEGWQIPAFRLPVVDPTGAGDAFTAGVAYGMARRWPWPAVGRFANALGALATRTLGAQSSLPTLVEVEATLADGSADTDAPA